MEAVDLLAVLLLALLGWAAFAALAVRFRPPRRVLCQPAKQYRGRHWAPGVEG